MLPQLRLMLVVVLMMVLPLVLVACDGETCEGACMQYFGDGEGQCNQPSVSSGTGTTQEEASTSCIRDCQEALYTTATSDASGNSAGGIRLLSNQTDALDFIHCVVDNDFTGAPNENPGADVCENLVFQCDRLSRW